MYINFWYPIAASEEITSDEPCRVEILGVKVAAFRDTAGTAHVLSDTCVHRGGSLGKGWVKDGEVVCPYHGWRYGGDGQCTTVPSLGYAAKPPARAKVDSYPVQEKYGIVFAFLGDLPEEERPPLYPVPEFGQSGWRGNRLVVRENDIYYERSMENALDPSHNEFVHPTHGYSGEKGDYRVKDFEVEERPFGCGFTLEMDSSEYKDGTMKRIRESSGTTVASTFVHGPNSLTTRIHLTETNWFHQYAFIAPIDETRTRSFFINMRNCLLDPEYDERIHARNMVISDQDRVVLTEVEPVGTPPTNTREVMMPADRAILRYREILKEWKHKGWRVDMQELRAKRGDAAFAVPCPRRRTTGNWVLDPVPLLATAEETRAAAE